MGFDQLQGELRHARLRQTRQRIALGSLLFGGGARHVTAEALYEQAVSVKIPVSLATVYNTLHQFTKAGLLNKIAIDGSRIYFDTNTAPHHHYYLEETNELVDLPAHALSVGCFREAPEGTEITRIDVIVRLRKLHDTMLLNPAPLRMPTAFLGSRNIGPDS